MQDYQTCSRTFESLSEEEFVHLTKIRYRVRPEEKG